jgi:hypothetical protein
LHVSSAESALFASTDVARADDGVHKTCVVVIRSLEASCVEGRRQEQAGGGSRSRALPRCNLKTGFPKAASSTATPANLPACREKLQGLGSHANGQTVGAYATHVTILE